ncbi:hypothetical protein GY45DRAFT_1339433 [Cubamyces sp. BRFM 1775]|nr:hypothetical protein GY45DRAFT_1339433 [Cubamyces sp. BRFM 1775]
MISTFPSPILSVAADVVRDLEGEDALCGLWALFTKCKESLKDGRRLENISWRLWYREMASAQSSPASSPGSLSPSLSDRRSPSPITPISEDGIVPQQVRPCHPALASSTDITQAHSWHGKQAPPSALPGGRRLSTLSTVSAPMERRKSHSSVGVGKMILDILPRKVDVDAEKHARPPAMPSIAQPRPVVAAVPTVQLPATPPPQSGGPSFPRVVVVNPTPHPTPPATPSVSHPPTLTATAQASTHLLPPQPVRPLVSATITSSPASTQPFVPSSAASQSRRQQSLAAAAAASPSSAASKRPSADAPSSTNPPTSSSKPTSKTYNDETLKASDRRFFLQDAGSPEVDSPERPPSNTSDARTGQSPSSGTSSHMRSEAAGPSAALTSTVGATGSGAAAPQAKRSTRVQVRKNKDRHVPVRPALQRLHSHGVRQTSQKKATVAEPKKAAFNIGSVSSNGSRADTSTKAPSQNGDAATTRTRSSGSGAPAKQPPAQHGKTAAGPSQQRRGIVISTSSEYETTSDTDDSDWASEGDSAEEREKTKAPAPTRPKGKSTSSPALSAEEARLRAAAEEAQRQRDMFAKVPKRSYSNLNRTRSGLLSQLLNPDPNIFPPNHPYRTTRSTQDMTQLGRQGSAPTLQMSKSTVAVPLAAQVTAQVAPTAVGNTDTARPGGGYRPKGRPQEAELEDTESDNDNPDDTIQVSRSLAQRKLAALADPNRRRHSDRGLLSQQQQEHQQFQQQMMQEHGRAGLTTVATAPIPLNHPYNLPPPPPPMTPRTTRRQMLQTELSESLRRNLLWERQVSRVNMASRRSSGVLGGGLRPLTAVNGDGPVAAQEQAYQQQQQPAHGQMQGQQQGPGHQPNASDREEQRRRAMARNRSWADEFHGAGW